VSFGLNLGWKKKAAHLRMVILSGAHQLAKELPPGLSKILDLYAHAVRTSDARDLQQKMERVIADHPDDPKPLWEPAEIYGWKLNATMYLRDEKLWWLVHAERRSEREPSEKDVGFLDKVIDLLGGEPTRHAIIGPRSSPLGRERLPFGWWTWQNRAELFDIQLNKDKKRDQDKIRIVPLGTRETDGYTSLRMDADEEETK
jgi:hypothetical protein